MGDAGGSGTVARDDAPHDLWVQASRILEDYGDRAPLHVAEKIGGCALAGDMDGIAAWKRLAHKLDALMRAPKV